MKNRENNLKNILIKCVALNFFIASTTINSFAIHDISFNGGRLLDGDTENINVQWVKSTGDVLDDIYESVINVSDGGFIAVGNTYAEEATSTNNGLHDAIITRYDKKGKQKWIRNFGGSNFDEFNSVIEVDDGGIVAVGYSDKDGADVVVDSDAIMVKYDKDGAQQWVKKFGGSGNEEFSSVIKTSDGGFVLAGNSSSSDAGFTSKRKEDAIIVKYDKSWNQQWVKNFGGSRVDKFKSVIETSDGGFLAVGDSNSNNAGFINNGATDAIIVKYDNNGNQEWFSSLGGNDFDYFTDVLEEKNGEFIVVGYSGSPDAGFTSKGGTDAIIVKYDSAGNQQWIKNVGGNKFDSINKILKALDEGFVVSGNTQSDDLGISINGKGDGIIMKYDKNWNQQWIKNFGGSNYDYINSIVATPGGELVVAGSSYSLDAGFNNRGQQDAIIVKYTSKTYAEMAVEEAESSTTMQTIENARDLVNKLPESNLKEDLQDRLDSMQSVVPLEKKNFTHSLDLYVKSENILSLSLDTSSITFEDFSGVEDMEKLGAINMTVSSSLPYEVNAYLPMEIQNSGKSKTMDKSILNIKASSEVAYNEFTDLVTPVLLLDNQVAGNDKTHGIDLKLNGGVAHEKDNYKTTIRFEVNQK